MSAKSIIVLVASALLVAHISACGCGSGSYLGALGYNQGYNGLSLSGCGCGDYSSAQGYNGLSLGLSNGNGCGCGDYSGALGYNGLGWAGNSCGCGSGDYSGALGYNGLGWNGNSCSNGIVASGGGLPVCLASPIAPNGVSLRSDNGIEGILDVCGALPVLSGVAFEGTFPTAGSAGVQYSCGGGNVGITSADNSNGLGANGWAGNGYGAPSWAGSRCGGCGCGC